MWVRIPIKGGWCLAGMFQYEDMPNVLKHGINKQICKKGLSNISIIISFF
jgi:hypothetical protein